MHFHLAKRRVRVSNWTTVQVCRCGAVRYTVKRGIELDQETRDRLGIPEGVATVLEHKSKWVAF